MAIGVWCLDFTSTFLLAGRLSLNDLNIILYFYNLFKVFESIVAAHPIRTIGFITLISFWGINFSFWGLVGLARLIQEKYLERKLSSKANNKKAPTNFPMLPFTSSEVAAIVPAHNEELVIQKTIISLLPLVPKSNIFVISDGSKDRTAELARSFDVKVLELFPAHGKAGALEAGIAHFSLAEKFKAVVFVDADTVLPNDYLAEALPFFSDPLVVAVAGYARTIWDPAHQTFGQTYFIAHREIVYTLSQLLLKFGQSWKYANVVTIVPGFASIYRAAVLKKINLNPPGLVIEDFNMTFEVHHKSLGKIVHSPKVSGFTQDPDNFHDYFRQVKRWNLGFWQTIRRHGFWPSKFSAFLILFVTEVLFASSVLIVLPLLFSVVLIFVILTGFQPSILNEFYFVFKLIAFGLWLPSILIGCIVGILQKRPRYFLYSPFFIFLKFIDAIAYFIGLYKAFLIRSSGRWISPSRRAN